MPTYNWQLCRNEWSSNVDTTHCTFDHMAAYTMSDFRKKKKVYFSQNFYCICTSKWNNVSIDVII
jgi:hypothetical protein